MFTRETRVQWRAFREALGACHYDVIVDTQGLVKSALIGWIARGNRCGYAAEAAREPLAARFYNRTFAIPRNLHAVDRNRWLALAPVFWEEANRRLRANGLPVAKFQKNPGKPVPVHPLSLIHISEPTRPY